MGVMPHTNIEEALEFTLSLDVPFWLQLSKVSFGEDMYAQASQHFPGIVVDSENERLDFNTSRFGQELLEYSEQMDDTETFALN